MPESQGAHLEVLTDAERESLERPGLRTRSRAIIAATELATKIGLSGDTHAVLVERLRALDKDDAKLAWQTLGDMNELLGMLSIDLREGNEVVVELSRPTTEALSQPEVPAVPEVPAAITEPILEPVEQPATVSVEKNVSLEEALDNLIAHESHHTEYNLARVETLLDQLQRGGVSLPNITAEDFGHDTLKQLALIYAEAAVRSDPEAIKTNIACTWGYLSGIEMGDLRIWRSATKQDATAADVHNSRTAFVGGVIKGWKQGLRPEFDTAEVEDDEEQQPVAEPEAVAEHALSSVPSVEDEAPEQPEHTIDDEPAHVRIVDTYIEKLDLSVNRRAFEELLNPNTRGEMTSAKTLVLESLRNRVGNVSPDGSVINELDISARAKSALRRMLGMGFVKHGRVEERAPEPLRQQLKNVGTFDQQGYADDLYSALEVLLETLTGVEPEAEEPKPLQVVFGLGDEVRLA